MKLNKLLICLFVSFGLLISACSTPRGLDHKASRPVATILEVKQDADTQNFAKTIAESHNSSIFLSNTPFGYGLKVNVENFYTSALGQKCRKATAFLENNQTEHFTVCQGNTGIWYYISALN